jgi:hypothetical protein
MLKADRETLGNIIDSIGEQEAVEILRIFNKKGVITFSKHHEEVNRAIDKRGPGCVGCHDGPVPSANFREMEQIRRFTDRNGAEILAIAVPIYNETSCSAAQCHVHPTGQQILGILDVGLDQKHLQDSLATMKSRMVLFSIMILILTVGGVAALLRRTIFLPLQRLAALTEQPAEPTMHKEFNRCSSEIFTIASNFSRLAQRLQKCEEKSLRKEHGSAP